MIAIYNVCGPNSQLSRAMRGRAAISRVVIFVMAHIVVLNDDKASSWLIPDE